MGATTTCPRPIPEASPTTPSVPGPPSETTATASRLTPRVATGGRTMATKYCVVDFTPDKASDAAELASFVDRSFDSMVAELSTTTPGLTLGLSCTVFQLATPVEGTATDALALSVTPNTGREIQVYLLARSSYGPTSRGMIGVPKDDEYQFKIVAHELSTVLFERVTRDKGGGWFFHEAPSWFTQGCEEYFGLVHSSPHNRALLDDYIARVRAAGSEVSFVGDALHVRNVYLGGAVLVAFLYDAYGAERVHALLASRRATFAEAFGDVIEPDRHVLGARFYAWLGRGHAPGTAP
jgi:hypothetical protein